MFAGLQKDNGLTSVDDKYDRINDFCMKEEYIYTGVDAGVMGDEFVEDPEFIIGRTYYRFRVEGKKKRGK